MSQPSTLPRAPINYDEHFKIPEGTQNPFQEHKDTNTHMANDKPYRLSPFMILVISFPKHITRHMSSLCKHKDGI
jgi:hypothetical protein